MAPKKVLGILIRNPFTGKSNKGASYSNPNPPKTKKGIKDYPHVDATSFSQPSSFDIHSKEQLDHELMERQFGD